MPAEEPPQEHRAANGIDRRRSGGWLSRLFDISSKEISAAQSYRRLIMQLDFDLGRNDTGRSLMLTAPDSETIACEAAIALAYFLAEELGHKVLLVDGSFNGSGVGAAAGPADTFGLSDLARTGSEDLDKAILPTGHDRIFLLPAGRARPGETVPQMSGKLKAIIAKASDRFGYVLLPTGPILEDPRSWVFCSLADCVLLLATEGKTMLDDLEASQKVLANCKAAKVGLVLTKPSRRWFRRR